MLVSSFKSNLLRRKSLRKCNQFYNRLNNIRGTTFVFSQIEDLLIPDRISINEIEIHSSNPALFKEQFLIHPVDGYIKYRDVKQSDTVLDSGAFPGIFSVYAAKKGAEVVAVEADPDNVKKMRQFFKENDVQDRITVVEKVLWKDDSGISFETGEGFSSEVSDDGEILESVSLDDLRESFDGFDFVKMDVEGAEEEILKDIDLGNNCFYAVACYHESSYEEFQDTGSYLQQEIDYSFESIRRHPTLFFCSDNIFENLRRRIKASQVS